MGRDHTIHAAVAGYVKYYRDPQRHPKRQYIGVVFNREDRLPYPVSAPRRRKLGLVAVPRRAEGQTLETTSSSGIPLSVTRREETKGTEKAQEAAERVAAAAKAAAKLGEPTPLEDGNSVIASLVREKLMSRGMAQSRKGARDLKQQEELEERRATRVFRLQHDYSYRESNWEIGRIVGDAGTVPGTEKTESRKARFRVRRRKRMAHFQGLKERKLAKAARREEYRAQGREYVAQRAAQRKADAAARKAKIET
jgi:protein phosphatase inhibitor 2